MADLLDQAELFVDGWIYPEEVILQVGFLPEGKIAQSNFEASIDYSSKQIDAFDKIHHCLDGIGALIEEFRQNPNSEFPREWKKVVLNRQDIFVRYTTHNTNLEAEADRLLGIDQPGLYNSEEEEDETNDDKERLH